jgi:hypothetical protein
MTPEQSIGFFRQIQALLLRLMRVTGWASEEKGSAESGAFKSFQQDKIRGLTAAAEFAN